ncbi:FG-GAP repeat domain-containing protein [candidate division CSSED10-310 bacterium]|uniref:FG-GAP repeat domain-containing protein n=1 Tax=candidate division CSSED10-310 bacterium TaxID=2855610 RepID=A0ABV6Z597_UNCC1
MTYFRKLVFLYCIILTMSFEAGAIDFQVKDLLVKSPVLDMFTPAGELHGLIVISRPENKSTPFLACNINLFQFKPDGSWSEAAIVKLPENIAFIDAGDINSDGFIDLVATVPEALVVFLNNGAGSFKASQTLLSESSVFGLLQGAGSGAGDNKAVRHKRLLYDVDRDGRLDVLLPWIKSTIIRFQDQDGSYPDNLKTELPIEVYCEVVGRDSKNISLAVSLPFIEDINSDGRSDVALFSGNGYRFYLQNEDRKFSTLDWNFKGDFTLNDYRPRVVPDLDGDGWLDIIMLITERKEGEMSASGSIAIFLHQSSGYPTVPTTSLKSEMIFEGVNVIDMDGNGLPDLSVPAMKFGLGMIVSAFRGKNKFTNLIYLQQKRGTFNSVPEMSNFTVYNEYALFSQEGDFNGDGRNDFLLATEKDELSIFKAGTKKGFDSKPWKIFTLDVSSKYHIFDVNKDGISDIVVSGEKVKSNHFKIILSKK